MPHLVDHVHHLLRCRTAALSLLRDLLLVHKQFPKLGLPLVLLTAFAFELRTSSCQRRLVLPLPQRAAQRAVPHLVDHVHHLLRRRLHARSLDFRNGLGSSLPIILRFALHL